MKDAFGNARTLPAPKPTTPSRMTLSAVTRGRIEKAPRVLLYGPEGCGKSTWAANSPKPIFLAAEDGTAQLDVARFPEPQTWQDVLDAVRELANGEHDFKTLVIDTLDWLEPLCWASLYTKSITSIEDFGYGKGYTAALDKWRGLLGELDKLHRQRGMGVVLLAHSWVKSFKNPEGEDYDRYELKLNNKAAGLLKEWTDAVLFARFESFTARDDKTKRVRGVSTGARVAHTVRTAAYDAKNRYDLPETLPLDYSAFAEAVAAAAPADPLLTLTHIAGLLESASDPTLRFKVQSAIDAAKGDAAQLSRVLDRLRAVIGIQQQTNEEKP